MPSYPNDVNPGQFIGTTQVYDLGEKNVNAEDFAVRLRQNFNNIVLALNIKDSGYYSQEEFVNGQLFYPDYTRVNSASSAPATFRQVFRKVINTGTLPNAGTTNTPHGITLLPTIPPAAPGTPTTFIATRIYGCATDPVNRIFIPLPYSSPTALNQNILVNWDATNVNITTGINMTAFTISQVVLEYVKF